VCTHPVRMRTYCQHARVVSTEVMRWPRDATRVQAGRATTKCCTVQPPRVAPTAPQVRGTGQISPMREALPRAQRTPRGSRCTHRVLYFGSRSPRRPQTRAPPPPSSPPLPVSPRCRCARRARSAPPPGYMAG
jgi:hypothetical protein